MPSAEPTIHDLLDQARRLAIGDYSDQGGVDGSHPQAELSRLLSDLSVQLREKKAIEEQLIHSQKLEMLGLLANCVAHDFNNLLSAITNALDLIGQEADAEERGSDVDWTTIRTSVLALRNSADRGRDTVRQMLSFSKTRDDDEHRKLDLNDVLIATEQMCRYSLDKRITVDVLPYPGTPWVIGSLSELQQALLNLCLNAQDAMPNGGQIMMSVDRAEQEPAYLVRVKDSGTGMAPEVAEKIFEPFYTTKGHGTGLGLVVVKRIADGHGGRISVVSKPAEGTEFRLQLPRAGDDPTKDDVSAEPKDGLRHAKAGECILLIDDEEAILKLNLRMLSKLGYETLAASSGWQAVELFREHREQIDLVVLDLMLPDMTGVEVFDELKAIEPNVKALLISGFSQDPRIAQLIVNGCEGFLKKPYHLSELSDAFRGILD